MSGKSLPPEAYALRDEIRARLRALRMTQLELSAASGVPKSTLSALLVPSREMTVSNLNAIANGLDTTADELYRAANRRLPDQVEKDRIASERARLKEQLKKLQGGGVDPDAADDML